MRDENELPHDLDLTRPLVRSPDGDRDDELDRLAFEDHYEDPERYEAAVQRLVARAQSEADIDELLLLAKMHPDRNRVFQLFQDSGVTDAIIQMMARFGVSKVNSVCDVGCGPGQLAWALSQAGFHNVSAMDPNATYVTGTGYLREIAGDRIDIINDLKEWQKGGREFDAAVTVATVHHWQHIPQISLMLRRNLKPGGLWFCTREFIANSSKQLERQLQTHLLWNRLKTYEWPYPASSYVDLISSVGFELIGVVPQFFAGNSIAGTKPPGPKGLDLDAFQNRVATELGLESRRTVEAFWDEVDHFRRSRYGNRLFTHPQMFIFKRVAPC